jgi:hypothetical protein
MKKEKCIYVAYIYVNGINYVRVQQKLYQAREYLEKYLSEDIVIVLPTISGETKVECINPKYLDNKNEYDKIVQIVDNLNKELKIFIENKQIAETKQTAENIEQILKKKKENIITKIINKFKN